MSLKMEFVERVEKGEKIAPLCREYGVIPCGSDRSSDGRFTERRTRRITGCATQKKRNESFRDVGSRNDEIDMSPWPIGDRGRLNRVRDVEAHESRAWCTDRAQRPLSERKTAS